MPWQMPESTDANLIIETVIGPLWIRLLLAGEPITAALVTKMRRAVLAHSAETARSARRLLQSPNRRSPTNNLKSCNHER